MLRRVASQARHAQCLRLPKPHGVAAIGDSITSGNSVPSLGMLGSRSWLAYAVCEGRLPYTYNAGLPNQTTEQIAARLPELLDREPRVVVVLAGTNDINKPRPYSVAIDVIGSMLTQITTAGAAPVLGTLPPFDFAPEETVKFNSRLRDLAVTQGVSLIDFHAALAAGDRFAAGMSDDGVHPSIAGARVMAAAAIPPLRAAL
jgi:lysophospholipase L1-like esterase